MIQYLTPLHWKENVDNEYFYSTNLIYQTILFKQDQITRLEKVKVMNQHLTPLHWIENVDIEFLFDPSDLLFFLNEFGFFFK